MKFTSDISLDVICADCDVSAVGFNDDGLAACNEHLLPDTPYTV